MGRGEAWDTMNTEPIFTENQTVHLRTEPERFGKVTAMRRGFMRHRPTPGDPLAEKLVYEGFPFLRDPYGIYFVAEPGTFRTGFFAREEELEAA